MELTVRNFDKNICVIKPLILNARNVESVIAKVKLIIFENTAKSIVIDLREINFLDCIKIGIIVGTYHFLDFSGRKIYILVSNLEIKKSIENLSFNNIEIHYNTNNLIFENIA